LALTDEPVSMIEKFVADKGITYPTAAGAANSSARAYGVSGYPSAYLIDHDGVVIWEGHPASLTDTIIEKAIEAAEAESPNWDPGERHEVLSKAVAAAKGGEMGRAWKSSESARKKAADNPDALAAIDAFQSDLRARGEVRMAKARRYADEGRMYQAVEYLEAQGKVYAGSPLAKEWKATTKAWLKVKEGKAQYDLDKKRIAALEKAREGDFGKAVKDLQKLIDKAGSMPIAERLRSDLQALRSAG